MPCFYPISAWRSRRLNDNGNREIVFNRQAGFEDMPLEVPCGRCIGCKLEYSYQWAVRIMHESHIYDDNCMITLTYNDKFLPSSGSLVKSHFQDFMKRFRKAIAPRMIRYFHCGEYGDENCRPHYHAIIFNYDFADKVLYREENDLRLYISAELDSYWQMGFSTCCAVTFDTAAYVARYVVKKVTGPAGKSIMDDGAPGHYMSLDVDTGELIPILPEYCTMSRGSKSRGTGGIARDFVLKYKKDIFPNDGVLMNGIFMKPPRFYNFCLSDDELLSIRQARARGALKHKDNATYDRLVVREKVVKAKLKTKKRNV